MTAQLQLRIQLRAQAVADAEQAVDWYLREAGPEVASRFVAALEAAYTHIARHPGTGSPRWGSALDLPGLRGWKLTGFPHIAFYAQVGDSIEVWRVLHSARDIPAWLAAEGARPD